MVIAGPSGLWGYYRVDVARLEELRPPESAVCWLGRARARWRQWRSFVVASKPPAVLTNWPESGQAHRAGRFGLHSLDAADQRHQIGGVDNYGREESGGGR